MKKAAEKNISPTKVFTLAKGNLGSFEATYEMCMWDGIHWSCIAFKTEDVKHLTDEEIISLVRTHPAAKDRDDLSLMREEKATYVNFDVWEWDDV